MPMRAPTQSLAVERNGKRVYPEIGVPFDFTNDEIEQAPAGSMTDVASVNLETTEVKAKPTKGKQSAGTSDL